MSMFGVPTVYGAGFGSGSSGSSIPWTSLYNQTLGYNTGLYNQMMSSYNTAEQQAVSAEQGVIGGYNALGQQVMGTIQGITASQQQAIKDSYAQQSGTASQGMINAGLGNTTVQQSVQSGLGLQEQKAMVALANQQAQLEAGYQSQIGLAGLNYAGQAVSQNASLASAQANQIAQYRQMVPQQYGMSGGGGMTSGRMSGLQGSDQVWVPPAQNLYGTNYGSGAVQSPDQYPSSAYDDTSAQQGLAQNLLTPVGNAASAAASAISGAFDYGQFD